jgi:hypothetical protein
MPPPWRRFSKADEIYERRTFAEQTLEHDDRTGKKTHTIELGKLPRARGSDRAARVRSCELLTSIWLFDDLRSNNSNDIAPLAQQPAG